MDMSMNYLIGAGVVVAVVAVLTMFSISSMQGTSYEEVMEAQRKKNQKDQKDGSKPGKQAKKKKAQKGDNKKKKGKKQQKEEAKPEEAPEVSEELLMWNSTTVEVVEEEPVVAEPAEPAVESAPESDAVVEEVAVVEKEVESEEVEAPVEVVQEVEAVKPKKKKGKKGGPVDDQSKTVFDVVTASELDHKAALALIRILTEKYNVSEWKNSTLSPAESKKQIAALTTQVESQGESLAFTQAQLDALVKSSAEKETQAAAEKANLDDLLTTTRKANAQLQKQLDEQMAAMESKTLVLETKLKNSNANESKMEAMALENTLFKGEIQKNSKWITDKQKLTAEVDDLKKKLKESKSGKAALKERLGEASNDSDKRQEAEKRIEDMNSKLQTAAEQYNTLESQFQKTVSDLQIKEEESTKLLSQVTSLSDENDSRVQAESDLQKMSETVQALETRLAELDANDESRAAELVALHTSNKDLTEQVSKLSAENETLTQKLKAEAAEETAAAAVAKEELTKASAAEKADMQKQLDEEQKKSAASISALNEENAALRTKTEELSAQLDAAAAQATQVSETQASDDAAVEAREAEVASLKEQLEKSSADLKKSAEDLEGLKAKNNNLREKNWKAMDAVAATEQNALDKCASLQKESDEKVAGVQSGVKSRLMEAFPNVSCSGGDEDFESWMQNFSTSAVASPCTVAAVGPSQDQFDALQKEAADLKAANSDTEERLTSQVTALQSSLDGALQRNKSIESEMEEVQRTSDAKGSEADTYKAIVDATELTLSQLQDNVQTEEEERQNKVKETKAQMAKLQSDLAAADKKFETQSSELTSLKEESARLSSERDEVQRQLDEVSKNSLEDTQNLEQQQQVSDNSTTQSRDSASPVSVPANDAQISISEDASSGFMVVDHSAEEQQQTSTPVQNGKQKDDGEEVARLKERLEKEKTLTKNLGLAANKLQSVLKQTQEHLNKERGRNKALKQQTTEEVSQSEVD